MSRRLGIALAIICTATVSAQAQTSRCGPSGADCLKCQDAAMKLRPNQCLDANCDPTPCSWDALGISDSKPHTFSCSSSCDAPATNLDAAWQACQLHQHGQTAATGTPATWDYDAPFQKVCEQVEARMKARAVAASDDSEKRELAIIKRGLADPDGKPQ
jgi:hypothetical protein